MTTLQSVGYNVGLPTNSTSADFLITPGRAAVKPNNLIVLSNPCGDRYRGLDFVFFGTGAENGQFDVRLHAVNVMIGANGEILDYDVQQYIQAAGVLGTSVGKVDPPVTLPTGTIPNTYLHTGNLVCDELTISSTSPYATNMVAMFKGVAPFAHSPSGNGQAHLCVPDIANAYGFVLDFDLGANCTSINFLWRAST